MTLIDQPHTSVSGALTSEAVSGFRHRFEHDSNAVRMQNAVTRTGLDDVALRRERFVAIPSSVSNRLDDWKVTNQMKSGRCWLFAALNLLRVGTKKRLGMKDFEFSQNHAMYWDKLERANFWLGDIVSTATDESASRLVTFLLSEPLGDGGQWDMATSIFAKHGVVPQQAMPETESSSNTGKMNSLLRKHLRRSALHLRALVAAGEITDTVEAARLDALEGVHRILGVHLGTPPETFEWQWTDDDKNFHRDGELTPQEFSARYVTLDLDDYVCLVDDPRSAHAKGEALTVANLGNVRGGSEVRYVNAPIEVMKQLAAASIVQGEPVWFGCDVGQQVLRKEGRWAADLFDYDGVYGLDLGMTKEDRVLAGDSAMTHAMLLTGVDLDGDTPRRWRVENSWGDSNGDQGFYTMDDSWFAEYVFEVVVKKSALPESLRPALTSSPRVLPAWDPMGALA
ncbi:aminopeptidase [Frondihabitans sp. PAMC 28766]|uniref:aminopeptidase C n=1 Tax=Frondihabitans sp. PAMC 28766 TaxID=1795630 RepID=UPI00078C997A|nr:C1 family peptidase [Frondihabitans sp. PAMC 28766]AMM21921.1 aminopeptidase [Frondihabitans sp. PAMC 28766]